MNSYVMKSLAICAFGAVLTAGCASSKSSPAVASTPSNIQRGKVAAVESADVIVQSAVSPSSGSTAVASTASGGPGIVTVQFNDGAQGRYIVDHPTGYTVGKPVQVITNGERITITSQ